MKIFRGECFSLFSIQKENRKELLHLISPQWKQKEIETQKKSIQIQHLNKNWNIYYEKNHFSVQFYVGFSSNEIARLFLSSLNIYTQNKLLHISTFFLKTCESPRITKFLHLLSNFRFFQYFLIHVDV